MNEIVMPFDGKRVEVVRDEQGNPWVGIRSVCNAIGIAWQPQVEKINKNSSFRRHDIMSPSAGGMQKTFCIPLNQLNGWLFSINPNKVHESIRCNLIAYQQECFAVLYNHFMPRGELNLQSLIDSITKVQNTCDEMNKKFDYLTGMDLTVFGDDAPLINELITKASILFKMSSKEVWGLVRRECDVSSYKLQNRKVINFLKNLIGEGLRLVKEEDN